MVRRSSAGWAKSIGMSNSSDAGRVGSSRVAVLTGQGMSAACQPMCRWQRSQRGVSAPGTKRTESGAAWSWSAASGWTDPPAELIVVDNGSRDWHSGDRAGARSLCALARPRRVLVWPGAECWGGRGVGGTVGGAVRRRIHHRPGLAGPGAELVLRSAGVPAPAGIATTPRPSCSPSRRAGHRASRGATPSGGYSNGAGAFRAELCGASGRSGRICPGARTRSGLGHWLARGYRCVVDPDGWPRTMTTATIQAGHLPAGPPRDRGARPCSSMARSIPPTVCS